MRLLVFFGGTDPGNQTINVIEALRALGARVPESTIVLGPAYPYRDAVHKSVVNLPKVQVLEVTEQMAMLIAQADLAIGACGQAAWERCALGLPSLVVVTAENQREDAEILHNLGAAEYLGYTAEVKAEKWESALRRAIENPLYLQAMAIAAYKVMVGRQAALAELIRTLVDGMH
jgi:UDP-2,4-diacetamido-2,4,6-trideoxy-beta-L-altropyranose hydrolase